VAGVSCIRDLGSMVSGTMRSQCQFRGTSACGHQDSAIGLPSVFRAGATWRPPPGRLPLRCRSKAASFFGHSFCDGGAAGLESHRQLLQLEDFPDRRRPARGSHTSRSKVSGPERRPSHRLQSANTRIGRSRGCSTASLAGSLGVAGLPRFWGCR